MYRGGIADQTRTLYAIVGINPSADFWIGRPFPSPVTKNGVFGDDCWVVDSNHILRNRHPGYCPFVGGSGPESLKFLSELPYLTLKNNYECWVAHY